MAQVAVYEYPVRRPFTYNNRQFVAGEYWAPEGLKNDQGIIDHFVNQAGARIKVNESGEQVQRTVPPRRIKPR